MFDKAYRHGTIDAIGSERSKNNRIDIKIGGNEVIK